MDRLEFGPWHQAVGEGVADAAAERVDHVIFGMAVGRVIDPFAAAALAAVRLEGTGCSSSRDGKGPPRLPLAPLAVLSPGPRLAAAQNEKGKKWRRLAVFRGATAPFSRAWSHSAARRAFC